MAKATAPVKKTATQEDENLPQTAVRVSGKDATIQNLQDQLAKFEVNEEPEPEPKENENLTAEEATFKKRYGDLRRHAQQKEEALKKEAEEYKKKLEQLSAAANQPMPKTKEEFEEWKKRYPDIATFVEIIADEKAGERAKQLQEELQGVKEKLSVTEKEKAEATLKTLVPDVETLTGTKEFQSWFNEQPPFVQEELKTSEDPYRIAYFMNIFKTATHKPVTKSSDKLASLDTSVKNTGISPSRTGTAWKFSQSQIAKMTVQEYEAKETEIIEARNAGLILDDLSKRNSVFDV